MPAPVEIQKATLSKFIDAWERWNADDFIGLWSDSFTFKVLPFSDEKPTRPRDKIEPMYRNFIGTLTNYKLDVKYVVHDAANGKACIYAVASADAPCGNYNNEQAIFISFSEGGDKIETLEEVNDNAFRKEWDPKCHAYWGYGKPPKAKEVAGS
ncbi:hypothetical protein E4U57_002777 [Claviceps arundinis]|uniref:SnoaL-like domain-containing protein n=1 Tax=Claviceps arundinis TaxID=1623583 RepID=A0A9P7SNA1_9HYPO|nr:hypothetical protein E4U57_002777 [Claviceps arundinis]KAG5967456.1 hypothetical protein E4U56_000866 [Claviceps arundinis]